MPLPHRTAAPRSNCPLSAALELFGDKWTLLVLRDLLFLGKSTFKEFLQAPEGIASNVLSDRLKRLVAKEIVVAERSTTDARVVAYRPTERGLDLLPVLVEIVLWAVAHTDATAPPEILKQLQQDRQGFIARVRARFR